MSNLSKAKIREAVQQVLALKYTPTMEGIINDWNKEAREFFARVEKHYKDYYAKCPREFTKTSWASIAIQKTEENYDHVSVCEYEFDGVFYGETQEKRGVWSRPKVVDNFTVVKQKTRVPTNMSNDRILYKKAFGELPDFKHLQALCEAKEEEARKLAAEMVNTAYALRTVKRLKAEWPELYKYYPVNTGTALVKSVQELNKAIPLPIDKSSADATLGT